MMSKLVRIGLVLVVVAVSAWGLHAAEAQAAWWLLLSALVGTGLVGVNSPTKRPAATDHGAPSPEGSDGRLRGGGPSPAMIAPGGAQSAADGPEPGRTQGRGEKIANVPGPDPLRVARIRSLTLMLVGLGLVIGGLLAGVTNGLTVLDMAGEMTDDSMVSRLSFVAPFVSVLLAAFAAVPLVLGPAHRRRSYVGLLFAALAVGGVGTYLYCAWMDGRFDPNLFGPAGPSSAAMIAGSILCGAMTVAIGQLMIITAWKSLCPPSRVRKSFSAMTENRFNTTRATG